MVRFDEFETARRGRFPVESVDAPSGSSRFGYGGRGGAGAFPEFDDAVGGGREDVAVSGGGDDAGDGLFVHVGDGVVGRCGDVGEG